jgi:hypothetical protein
MVKIPETTSNLGFVKPFYFVRDGVFRERIVDCSREQLIDLSFHFLGLLEKEQGIHQRESEKLEKALGWCE